MPSLLDEVGPIPPPQRHGVTDNTEVGLGPIIPSGFCLSNGRDQIHQYQHHHHYHQHKEQKHQQHKKISRRAITAPSGVFLLFLMQPCFNKFFLVFFFSILFFPSRTFSYLFVQFHLLYLGRHV